MVEKIRGDKQNQQKNNDDNSASTSVFPSSSFTSNSVPVSSSTSNICQSLSQFGKIPEFDPKVINHIELKTYPKSDNNRCFHREWFSKFEWLEYDPVKNVALCYPCRVFSTTESKETAFSKNGYSDWKNALCKRNGLPLHNDSVAHKTCMAKWNEHNVRIGLSKEVSTLVNDEILSKRRYYVELIFEMIKFLVVNQLPLRGTYDKGNHVEKGLFQALFQYTLKQNNMLNECAKIIPKNATYLSGEIQNEMISCMAICVRHEIVKDINNADEPFICLMADGTRDKNNHEAVSIVARFVKEGKGVESLLSIEEAKDLTAAHLTDLILKTLTDNGIDLNYLLCQCYDGANVMKGWKGGVQALVEAALDVQYRMFTALIINFTL